MRPREVASLTIVLAGLYGSPARAEWEKRCKESLVPVENSLSGTVYVRKEVCEDVWVDRAGESANRLRAAREYLALCKEMGKPQEQCNAELAEAIKSGRLYGDGPQKD